jgi:hypothetical protein
MPPVLLVLAGFALVTALLAWSRWLAGRRWASAGHALLALGAAVCVATSWPMARQLADYEPEVTGEAAIGELSFEQLASDRFRVTLTRLPSGRMQVFDLQGDEWRLDVRTLRWTGYAADLGLAPRRRLERLASRTAAATDMAPATVTAYRLAGIEQDGAWPPSGSPWARAISASEQSSQWQPLVGGTRFRVRLTTAGVVVVPRNDPAAEVEFVAPP